MRIGIGYCIGLGLNRVDRIFYMDLMGISLMPLKL